MHCEMVGVEAESLVRFELKISFRLGLTWGEVSSDSTRGEMTFDLT